MHAYTRRFIEIELHLAPQPASVSKARHALDELRIRVPPQALDDLRLLVSELVTNSVLHAGLGPADLITLKVTSLAGVMRVEVADHGPGFDPAPPYEPGSDGAGGRGLYLIDEISSRWDVDREGGISRVWAEASLDPGTG